MSQPTLRLSHQLTGLVVPAGAGAWCATTTAGACACTPAECVRQRECVRRVCVRERGRWSAWCGCPFAPWWCGWVVWVAPCAPGFHFEGFLHNQLTGLVVTGGCVGVERGGVGVGVRVVGVVGAVRGVDVGAVRLTSMGAVRLTSMVAVRVRVVERVVRRVVLLPVRCRESERASECMCVCERERARARERERESE